MKTCVLTTLSFVKSEATNSWTGSKGRSRNIAESVLSQRLAWQLQFRGSKESLFLKVTGQDQSGHGGKPYQKTDREFDF